MVDAMHASPTKGWCSVLPRWIPVILWASLIFYFSTENFSFSNTEGFLSEWLLRFFPQISPARFMALHLVSRKAAHWCEYFVFGILLVRAQRRGDEPRLATAAIARTLVLVLAYAASDEYHQSWVPERTASAVDVAIDTFGGVCGLFWMCLWRKRSTGE